jgi:hypothetical protein
MTVVRARAEIRETAVRALASNSPAAWVLALDKIRSMCDGAL